MPDFHQRHCKGGKNLVPSRNKKRKNAQCRNQDRIHPIQVYQNGRGPYEKKFRDAIIKIRAQKRPKTFSRCDAKNAYFVTKEATRLQRFCLMKN